MDSTYLVFGVLCSIFVFNLFVFFYKWWTGKLEDKNKNGIPDSLERSAAALEKLTEKIENIVQ
jgi:hypothetical protein